MDTIKVSTVRHFLIDTEPEYFRLLDSNWKVKLIHESSGSMDDISDDVTVIEIIDYSITDFSNAITLTQNHNINSSALYYSGNVGAELRAGQSITIGSLISKPIYQITSVRDRGDGTGIIRLDRQLDANVGIGERVYRVGNTGSYRFSYQFDAIGRYILVLQLEDDKFTDITLGKIEVVEDIELNLENLIENKITEMKEELQESIDNIEIPINDNSKILAP